MGRSNAARWIATAAALAALAGVPEPAGADTEVEQLRRDLESMRREMQRLHDRLERQDETIRALERKGAAAAPVAGPAPPPPAAPPGAPADAALDRALAEAQASAPAPLQGPALFSRPLGGANLRLIDVSFDILFAAGTSTADDAELATLQGGAHDPNQRGFTFQQGELSFSGAIDPYFTGESHIVFTPDGVELEEAFFTTTALPYGLQAKGGFFLTEFGRLNPTHPHAWPWVDQPVINTRLFSGDGLRNPGMRLGWLVPVPWYSEIYLGAQNASGETTVSFVGEDDFAGRPPVERTVHDLADLLYLARWANAWNVTDTISTKVGGSMLYGPNSSGAHGRTYVYGGDAVVKWRPANNFRGWPFVIWQSEAMQRNYRADAVLDPGVGNLPTTELYDWGLYTQLLWGFRHPWAAGIRYEYASGSGASVGGRENDPLRDDRQRVSPLLVWHPSEFSRIRLQYNFDHAGHLPRDESTVWLGFELFYGAHAAHPY